MTLYDILDHDHDVEHVESRDRPDLAGETVIERCAVDACEWRRARWVDRTTLDDFGGAA